MRAREVTPVIGVIAGTVGCFGGMSIAAALCSYLVVTKEARLGLNGPQVIEQEAGIREYNSKDKPFIWQMTGGEVRAKCGFVDNLVRDDVLEIKKAVEECAAAGVPEKFRTSYIDFFLEKLSSYDTTEQAQPGTAEKLYQGGFKHE